jgi:hypothetical protein
LICHIQTPPRYNTYTAGGVNDKISTQRSMSHLWRFLSI